jgi:acetyl-CoA synthetase/medium-chain acyl-CoA synthetase
VNHDISSYAHARATFDFGGVPDEYNWVRDHIHSLAAEEGRLAMVWSGPGGEERRITYDELVARASRVSALLRRVGITKGDRVAIVLPRIPEWWEAVLGVMQLGGVSMPGTVLLTTKDLEYRLSVSGARGIITNTDGAGKVEAVASRLPDLAARFAVTDGGDPPPGWIDFKTALDAADGDDRVEATRSDDPAMIYFTSGTTGQPKMVLHTHASYPIGSRITGRFWLDLTPADLHWNMADNGWAKAAWSSLFGPWGEGAAIFVQDQRGKFEPSRALETLARYPITSLCAPPTVYRSLVLENLTAYAFPHLRSCVAAGEPLNPEVIAAWREATGVTIRDGYGQTETVVLVANFPSIEVRPGSMGKPAPGFDVSVIDEAGNELVAREGDIAVRVRPKRPIGLFREYWRDPAATERCIRGDWYVTGDRAVRDEDGYLWFVGRADDVIISAGYRIGPFEVESALLEHPAVAEAAVVASPDDLRGHVVKAFVVLTPDSLPGTALATELQQHVRTLTAPYKYPRMIEFVAELPKTASGKIRRNELRRREEGRRDA